MGIAFCFEILRVCLKSYPTALLFAQEVYFGNCLIGEA